MDRQRLIHLLGMLGSDHDGEVLNAARLAHQLVKSQKLTWEETLNACAKPLGGANRAAGGGKGEQDQELNAAFNAGFEAGVKSQTKPKPSWRQWAKDRVANDEDCLSSWELNFFGSFGSGRFAVPSDKQHAIFVRVAERLDLELPESPHRGNGSTA